MAEIRAALCYRGGFGLKHRDYYDNQCVTRIRVYYAARADTLPVTFDAMHKRLRAGGWRASMLYTSVEDGLVDPDMSIDSMPATYRRGTDSIDIAYFPVDQHWFPQFVPDTGFGENSNNPSWRDERTIDGPELRTAVGEAGGDLVISVTAERIWFENA